MVVSTATLALQHQLVDHDLPRLAEAVSRRWAASPPSPCSRDATTTCVWPNWTVARPRSRTRSSTPTAAGRSGWARPAGSASRSQRIREWADETETGDRDELDPGVDDSAWRLVSMPARECVGAMRCPFGEECFAEASRARAREVDIVVTNHSLLAVRHAGRPAHHPDRTGCSSSTRRTSWPTGSSSASQAELTPEVHRPGGPPGSLLCGRRPVRPAGRGRRRARRRPRRGRAGPAHHRPAAAPLPRR